jgi:cytochrome P450/nitrite reductase/ring-hydroxylating ferredoxin subunit
MDEPADRWRRIARVEDLRGDGPHALGGDGFDLVGVRSARGELRVYDGRCPHQGALLAEGELEGGALVCRNHRWRFDPTTGRRDGGPECLRACPTEVRGAELWVDVSALQTKREATRTRRRIADLPSPPGLPLIGNTLQIDVPRFHLILEDWARVHGAIYRVDVVGRPLIAVSDVELIEQVLRDRPETWRRDDRVPPVFSELGVNGVFAAEGAAWRSQRRLAMEGLAQKNVRASFPTLRTIAERLHHRWERAAERGTVLDLPDELMRFTVDVTTSLVFGRDLHTLDGGEDVIQNDLSHIFPAFARRLNSLLPYWRLFRLPRDREVDRAVAAVHAWLRELIADARRSIAEDPSRAPTNFMEAMIAARDEHGRPFPDDILIGNGMTMLLAGEDTTAYSLGWAVHLLLDHPEEVSALRSELESVLGDAPVPRTLEETNRLDVASAIANEAMRLKPVAPLNFAQANHDTVLGDVEIPKDTTVVLLHKVPQTSARHFTDPQVFRPQRWLRNAARAAHDPAAFMPFGSGPRICPGRSLALIEMRLVLATLYQSFDVIRVGNSSDVAEKFAFTMSPTQLPVRLRKRL